MRELGLAATSWILRREGWCIYLLGALAFAAIPLWLGHLGIGWDALNHHFYLGWTAEQPRFDLDHVAANYQAYQYPYLYWPVYKLAMAGATGVQAGVVLALLHSAAIPPVWMIARGCIPGRDAFTVAMRGVAVALAFLTGAVLSLFDSTSNDLLGAIPLLWAYAVALRPIADPRVPALRATALSGALAGMSVAFKLSNGPLAIVLPLLWAWPAGGIGARLLRVTCAGLCVLTSCLLFYGYWGWELWSRYGNPVYPLYDHWFEGLRHLTGWQR